MKTVLSLVVLTMLMLRSVPAGSETWIALPSDSWSPSEAQIAVVKTSLEQHMQALAKDQGISMPDWDRFTIQYEGAFDSGRRQIHIHGSCFVPDGRDPRRTRIIVLDGGSCFFSAVYDLETKSYTLAMFNGEA